MYAAVAAVLLLIFIWQPIPATGKPIGTCCVVLAAVGREILRRNGRRVPGPRAGRAVRWRRARLAAHPALGPHAAPAAGVDAGAAHVDAGRSLWPRARAAARHVRACIGAAARGLGRADTHRDPGRDRDGRARGLGTSDARRHLAAAAACPLVTRGRAIAGGRAGISRPSSAPSCSAPPWWRSSGGW